MFSSDIIKNAVFSVLKNGLHIYGSFMVAPEKVITKVAGIYFLGSVPYLFLLYYLIKMRHFSVKWWANRSQTSPLLEPWLKQKILCKRLLLWPNNYSVKISLFELISIVTVYDHFLVSLKC